MGAWNKIELQDSVNN